MVATKINNSDYDFTDIFPTCKQEYDEAKNSCSFVSFNNPFGPVCSVMGQSLGITDYTFPWTCQELSCYLNNIKSKKVDSIERNCKYFNYMLKYVLVNYTPTCEEEKSCYNKMITLYEAYDKYEFDKCKTYVDNLDHDTFSKFQNLYWLYNNLKNFEIDSHKCPKDRTYFKKYMKFYEICQANNNSSYCDVLRKFKVDNMKSTKDENACSVNTKILHQADRRDIRKYIPYGSYVKPRILKLMNIWNGKNNELPILIDSSEEKYKNLTDINYLISYKSLDY
ncbi:variable surface protein [Plasmodium gonderi]|uniref:Variable surface protein n=1 Tax=Plasmodium gonderi TaxID=77519 RepID=A0A1Y1JPQ5_PLAGO|nr:variable surface protein [Plasmodium gonderi]GAW84429.1 variable surface protein [Plasmodium gonderi]